MSYSKRKWLFPSVQRAERLFTRLPRPPPLFFCVESFTSDLNFPSFILPYTDLIEPGALPFFFSSVHELLRERAPIFSGSKFAGRRSKMSSFVLLIAFLINFLSSVVQLDGRPVKSLTAAELLSNAQRAQQLNAVFQTLSVGDACNCENSFQIGGSKLIPY